MPRKLFRVDQFHPTIGSVYHAMDEYLEELTASPFARDATPPMAMLPIDALLIHLLASYQSARPYVVDLASASTSGTTTLLCRTNPAIRQVITPCDKTAYHWRFVLDRHFSEWPLPLVECLHVAGEQEALECTASNPTSTLVITASCDAEVQRSPETFENWLEMLPQAIVVLLGVEKIGESRSLASLIVRCTGSPYRLALPRELAPSLVESRLAFIGRRDHGDFESSLARIGQLFANQFQFIDLIKRVCDSALEQSVLTEPLHACHRAGYLEPQSLHTTYDLQRALAEREQELLELRQSLSFRIVQKIRRLCRLSHLSRSALRYLSGGRHPEVEGQSADASVGRAA